MSNLVTNLCKENMQTNFREYQKEINTKSIKENIPIDIELSIYILELVKHSGEMAEIVNNHLKGNYNLYTNSEAEKVKAIKEKLGNVLASLTLIASHFAISLEMLAASNLESFKNNQSSTTVDPIKEGSESK